MVERVTMAILQLLHREREALRQGALAQVLALAPAKEATIDALPADLPLADRRLIRDAAARNGKLLQAALAGLRTATGHKSRLSQAVHGFQHYQPDGREETLSPAPKALEQRR